VSVRRTWVLVYITLCYRILVYSILWFCSLPTVHHPPKRPPRHGCLCMQTHTHTHTHIVSLYALSQSTTSVLPGMSPVTRPCRSPVIYHISSHTCCLSIQSIFPSQIRFPYPLCPLLILTRVLHPSIHPIGRILTPPNLNTVSAQYPSWVAFYYLSGLVYSTYRLLFLRLLISFHLIVSSACRRLPVRKGRPTGVGLWVAYCLLSCMPIWMQCSSSSPFRSCLPLVRRCT
jgi:hypothetical protein